MSLFAIYIPNIYVMTVNSLQSYHTLQVSLMKNEILDSSI